MLQSGFFYFCILNKSCYRMSRSNLSWRHGEWHDEIISIIIHLYLNFTSYSWVTARSSNRSSLPFFLKKKKTLVMLFEYFLIFRIRTVYFILFNILFFMSILTSDDSSKCFQIIFDILIHQLNKTAFHQLQNGTIDMSKYWKQTHIIMCIVQTWCTTVHTYNLHKRTRHRNNTTHQVKDVFILHLID